VVREPRGRNGNEPLSRSAKRFSEASHPGLVALDRRGDGSREGALFPGVDARWWSRRRGGSNPRRGSRGTGSLFGVGALERIQGVGVWCGSPGRSQGLSGGSRSADGGRPRRSVGHAGGRPFVGATRPGRVRGRPTTRYAGSVDDGDCTATRGICDPLPRRLGEPQESAACVTAGTTSGRREPLKGRTASTAAQTLNKAQNEK